jgi:16S rRNA (guanine527-N7)-methyltransferase
VTEEEAHLWLVAHLDVPRETLLHLEGFATLLRREAAHQNLVAASTLDHVWARHIVDSAQLLSFAKPGPWLDLGSGAGFPGLVVAALTQSSITLVESRKKRAAFLDQAAIELGVGDRVHVRCTRLEAMETAPFSVISARAFAPLDRLLTLAYRFSTRNTVWLLPKGKNASNELDAARGTWQGNFRIVPSVTDADSSILVLSDVRRRKA